MKVSTLDTNVIETNPYSRLIISKKSPLHNHTFFEFSVCLSGNLVNVINGKNHAIEKGRIVLLRPTDTHYFYTQTEHTSRDVYVSVEKMKLVCDMISPDLYDKVLNNELLVNFTVSSYQLNLLETEMNYFNKLSEKPVETLVTRHIKTIFSLFDLWQQSLSQNTADIPDWISVLLPQLNTESFITKSIAEIIEYTNYSHGYVCREFKKHVGTTLQKYMNDLKLSYSLSLLYEKSLSIERIAEKLNYCEVPNYIIAFKKKFGVTPAKWRKLNC